MGFGPFLSAIRPNNQLIVLVALTLHSASLLAAGSVFLLFVPPYTPVLLCAVLPIAVAACLNLFEDVAKCTQQLSSLASTVWMLAVVFIFFSGRANLLT